MLSTFEGALLDRHLRGCASCSAFAADATAQTSMLRAAPLEQPARRVLIETAPTRTIPARAAGALSACLVAAAAAAALVWPGGQTGVDRTSVRAPRTGAPVLVVVPAEPSMSSKTVVPRLKMRPASIADGPVHGYFSTPVST